MYLRATCHSSCCSASTAPTRRITAFLLGKMPTTSVLLLTSRLSLSSGLLLQICRQCSFGKAVKASTSSAESASRDAAWGNLPSSCSTTLACCAQTDSESGCAKMERTSVATRPWALFGTRHSRLRMKCVRQRSQTAPGKVAAIASFSPGSVSYTHLRAHETRHDLVCRLLLEKKKNK